MIMCRSSLEGSTFLESTESNCLAGGFMLVGCTLGNGKGCSQDVGLKYAPACTQASSINNNGLLVPWGCLGRMWDNPQINSDRM